MASKATHNAFRILTLDALKAEAAQVASTSDTGTFRAWALTKMEPVDLEKFCPPDEVDWAEVQRRLTTLAADAPETLPDDHTRTLALTLTVAEFRELMRSVGYRSAELADDDPLVTALDNIQAKVGHAWEAAGPSGALAEYEHRKAIRDSVEISAEHWDEVTHLTSDGTFTWCGVPGPAMPSDRSPWDGKTQPTCEHCLAMLAERP